MCLPNFDLYWRTVAPNFFKSHTNSWCSDFFKKKVLPDVRSDIPPIRINIVSTGQYSGHKKYIFRPGIARIVQGVQCKNYKVHLNSMGICNNNTEYFSWWNEKRVFLKRLNWVFLYFIYLNPMKSKLHIKSLLKWQHKLCKY